MPFVQILALVMMVAVALQLAYFFSGWSVVQTSLSWFWVACSLYVVARLFIIGAGL